MVLIEMVVKEAVVGKLGRRGGKGVGGAGTDLDVNDFQILVEWSKWDSIYMVAYQWKRS